MLTVTVPEAEYYNPSTNEFLKFKAQVLQLEHSLVSMSKWEAEKCRPFLGKDPKTNQDTYDYIRCMTLTQNIDPEIYGRIPDQVLDQVSKYIESPMTATTFVEDGRNKTGREVITSELIYYWMIALNIPWECQKWHLNRLFTLIRVCNLKNTPNKKMSSREVASRNRSLNEARRAKLQTKG